MINKISGLIKYYIIILVFSLIIWFFIFDQLTRTQPTEQIRIFIAASEVDSSYKDSLIEEGISLGLKEVSFIVVSPDQDIFSQLLLTQGLYETDILILPEKILETSILKNQFVDLELDYLSQFNLDLNQFELYTKESVHYGIKVYQKDVLDLFDGSISFIDDEPYYLLINATRPNVGRYYVSGGKTTENSFKIIQAILENKN